MSPYLIIFSTVVSVDFVAVMLFTYIKVTDLQSDLLDDTSHIFYLGLSLEFS